MISSHNVPNHHDLKDFVIESTGGTMIDIQAMPTWFPRNGRLCPYVWETSSARGGVGPRLNVSNSRGTVTL